MNIGNIKYYLIRGLSDFFPRNKHLWITGKITGWEYSNHPPMFFDNSKYFFLYLVNETDEKVYWMSDSEEEIKMLQEMNLPVVKFNSMRGKWLVARAKYSFHHYGPNQINRILQFGAVQIDFWHGTPLKKIRYDVIPKEEHKANPLATHYMKSGCEYIASTSEFLSKKVLCGAFAAEDWQMLNFGYPRMDIMKYDKETIKKFCKRYSKSLLPYIESSEGKKVFLYMPTFRDDDIDYFEKAGINYGRLNDKLEENNAVFFLKLHPLTKNINIEKYDNIIQISNDIDIYPFLKFVDYLITDYSSIFFDFLPLDKEILFIPYDYENYVKKRQLYFDYDEITPGKKYKSFDEFIEDIDIIDKLDYSYKRRKIRNLFITNYNFDACERTYNFFKNINERKKKK